MSYERSRLKLTKLYHHIHTKVHCVHSFIDIGIVEIQEMYAVYNHIFSTEIQSLWSNNKPHSIGKEIAAELIHKGVLLVKKQADDDLINVPMPSIWEISGDAGLF